MRKIIKERILNSHNATREFARFLKEKGFKVQNKRKLILQYNNKLYHITITNANKDFLECRQFNLDGFITMHEKTGKIYIVNKEDLKVGTKTREFNDQEFYSVKTKDISEDNTFKPIKTMSVNKYKKTYMDVAANIGNEIIANCYRKLK